TPLSASRALEIALQVCEGLASAHDIGIIHRDIKPRNIMIGKSDGTVKITDWGVAKNIEKAGIATSFVGTWPYMSPEVVDLLESKRNRKGLLAGHGVDHRTDIYSLGITMFEMLCGKYPFDDPNQISQGVGTKQEAELTSKGVHPSLAEIILKA